MTAERASRCAACGAAVHREARFCPACGAYRNPPRDRLRRREKGRESGRRIALVIGFYFAILATILPLHFVSEESQATGVIVVTMLDAALVLAFVPLLRVGLPRLLVPGPPALLWAGIGLAGLVPLLLLNLGYHRLLVELLGLEPESLREQWAGQGYGLTAVVLVVCVMPGIFEELAFRGLIQGAFERILGPVKAVTLAAALFAVIHRNLVSAPILFLLGVFLGELRRRSGSLYPSILVHFAHNLAVVLL